jgi:hypothetical protein
MLAAIGIILVSKQIPLLIGYDKPDFWQELSLKLHSESFRLLWFKNSVLKTGGHGRLRPIRFGAFSIWTLRLDRVEADGGRLGSSCRLGRVYNSFGKASARSCGPHCRCDLAALEQLCHVFFDFCKHFLLPGNVLSTRQFMAGHVMFAGPNHSSKNFWSFVG